MTRASHHKFLKEIAATTHAQGWAVGDVNTLTFLQTVNAWGFPLYPDKTAILDDATDLYAELVKFVDIHDTPLRQPKAWLGTWRHPHTKRVYLDITTSLPDLDDAVAAARAINKRSIRKIEAVYNSFLDETLFLSTLS